MNNRKQALIFVLLLLSTSVSAQVRTTRPQVGLQENRPDRFLLQHAHVVVSPDREFDADVLVQGQRIVQVGANLPVEPGTAVIDCEGRHIYAGLIDGFSEMDADSKDNGPLHWNPGVRPERSMAKQYDPSRETNDRYRKSGFVARLVAPRGGQIKGTSAIVGTGNASANEQILRDESAVHVSLTVSRGRDRESYPSSPMGAVALVRQTLYDAQWYAEAWQIHEGAPRTPTPERNDALAALNQLREKQVPWMIDTSNERYALRADRLAQEFGLPIIIRGSGREYRRLAEVAATGRSIILPVAFPKAPDVSTPEAARQTSLERLMHWDLAPENPAMLVEAGVEVAFSTSGLEKPSLFLPAIRKAIHRGLSKTDALAAITTVPAQLFDLEGDLGTVEAGKLASFVVTDGPLFDKKTKILETWVAGMRDRYQRDTTDIRGAWTIRIDGHDATVLKIRGSDKKPAGTIDEKKLNKLTWEYDRLSIDAPGSVWKRTGVVRVTLVVQGTPTEGESYLGRGQWPDGDSFRCSATWNSNSEDTDKDESSPKGPDTEKSNPNDEDDAADSDSSAGKDASDEPSADEPQIQEASPNGSSNEDAGGSAGDRDDEKSPKKSEKPTDPLFAVNFPLGAYGRESLPPCPDIVAFQNGTVWTNTDQGILENASVVVRSGKISAVGVDISIPPAAKIIDLKGQHLTPGIIDCHSHIATDGGVNEGTQAVTAEVRIGDFVDPDDISIYRQLAGGVTAANVLHGSANPIGGQNQVIKMRWGVAQESLKFAEAPPGVKFALGENVKQSNWGDDHRTRYPQTRMGVDEIIADAFERAVDYSRRHKAWRTDRKGLPPRIDLELEALAQVVAGERWIHCHSYRQSELMALMKTCDRYGITIGTFQHILEGYKVADEMAKRGIMGSAFADWWAYKFEVYDAIPHAGTLMHNAGVVVSFNSDDAELGRHLNVDAAKAIRYGGLSDEEALKFVTLNPAKQLRIDQYVGSIAPGMHADLAVWSTSPMSVYAACQQTWVDGRPYFSRDEDSQLRKRDQQRHAAIVQRILDTNSAQLKPDEDDKNDDELWPREDTFCHGHGAHGHE